MRVMDDSIARFGAALSAFGDRMGDTRLVPLGIALGLHVVSLLLRSWVWRGILRAAFPDRIIGLRPVAWSYLAGIGANAVAPFRGGDVVRIYAIRRHLPGASVATIVSTLIAETALGAVVVAGLALAAAGLGWLPPVIRLPDARAFEFSFYARHATALVILLTAGITAAALAARWAAHHVQTLWLHTIQGLRILRSPARFLRIVTLPQLVDWMLRVGVAYALLAAFGLPASVRYAVLVVVVDSVSTTLPFTPGGVGAQQGLLVFALAGAATSAQVLAFSIGAQAVIVALNILLGIVAVFAMFGHVRLVALGRETRASQL
jgi:uncharacterized membrane protein YbhN (UPF0104 family)